MKAAILSVGTELLFGQIINTNSAEISRELNFLGIDVLFHFAVGDNQERLRDVLRTALERCDLIVATGGLGPTQDDLTKETVAEVMNRPLRPHQDSENRIRHYFDKVKRPMTENNLKQAWLPEGAEVFANHQGTAPGFALEANGKTIACLPGPPREMRGMLQESLLPYLARSQSGTIRYAVLKTYGIGESALETELLDLIDNQTDPTLATYAGEGECTLRIASKAPTETEAWQRIEGMKALVLERIGAYVYSDENKSMAQVLAERLLAQGLTLSCAESCTGGLFASMMTSIPGVSRMFQGGYIVYSNEAKVRDLGVLPETIRRHGAASPETAREMAAGLLTRTGTSLGIAAAGIAGPDGGGPHKPVGYFCIAAARRTSSGEIAVVHEERILDRGNRVRNQHATALAMIHLLLQTIQKKTG